MYKKNTAFPRRWERNALFKLLRVMKLAFILLCICFWKVNATSYAQAISIHKQRANLITIFKDIQKQSDYHIFYDAEMLRNSQPVNLQLHRASIREAMDQTLLNQGLTYEILDKNIIIKKAISPALARQERSISGTVVDINGNPLPSVTVRVKNSRSQTSTDASGRYTIKVTSAESMLVYSLMGYGTEERTAQAEQVLNVQLTEQAADLNEVVVVGYGTQKRTNITGSVVSVNANDIKDIPAPSVDAAIMGKMAGVQVSQTTGTPGGGLAVKVRGIGSIGAGNEPLYVIDGFPITANYDQGDNPLNSINPSDVQSVEVLKDASATAIYGSRGSNGVIIITTKSGKSGKMKIDLDTYSGLQKVTKYMDVMNAREFAEYIIDSRNNAWVDIGGDINAPNDQRSAIYQILPELQNPDALGEGTNWQKEVLRTAPMHNIQLRFSGGNEQINYMTSAGYFKQDGIILNSEFERYSFRVNLDANTSKKFRIGLNLSPSYTISSPVTAEGHFGSGAIVLSALMMAPHLPVYNPDGTYTTGITLGNGFSSLENPVKVAKERMSRRTGFRLLGTAFAEYAFIDALKYKLLVGTDLQNTKHNTFNPSTIGFDGNPAPVIPSASYNSQESSNWLIEHTLNYNQTFGQHHIDALAGFTAQKVRSDFAGITATNFPNDLVQTINAGVVSSASTTALEWSLLSYLGRINYDYAGKYLFTATLRTDGSSRFGANNRWGVFPSFSGGWRLSQEQFMADVSAINELKLRASYGFTGNNFIGNYDHIGLLNTSNYVFGDAIVNGIGPSSVGNENLGWEKNKQLDVALELGLFGGRLFLVADYYHKITSDLLLKVPVPSLTGYTEARQNIGRVKNQGWEFDLRTQNLTGNLKWTTDLNFSFNRNKVLALGPSGEPIFGKYEQITNSHITAIGQAMGSYYGYQVIGIFQNQAEIDQNASFADSKPGQFRFADVNGDGQLSVDDRTVLGNPQPDYIFGITNTLRYKNVELSFLIQGVQGNEIMHLGRRFYANFAGTANGLKEMNNRWRSPENPGDGITPRANRDLSRYSSSNASANISSTHIEDGSFIRLRNISLAYNLPSHLLEKWKLRNVRIYAQAQNLFTITNYTGYNPEVSVSGINALTPGVDYGGYPIPKTFTLGLNLGF
ncbi:TonB-dependent receptor [Olivibacter sp. CPCC 100613]|uniref:TonB-dependent receptor n=1 Tax=Olivibacter sp. CPCC 100613 TaxID=3079931 RepID=UPI002FFC626D